MTETNWDEAFRALPSEELDKLAVLRVMECTNGVIQHLFRDEDPDALDVDETRRAMKFSMGAIKRMEIQLDDCDLITFADDTKELMWQVRDLYLAGVKRGDDEAFARFLVASSACLRACGMERLEQARSKLYNNCYEMPSYTWDWGMSYIRNFISAVV